MEPNEHPSPRAGEAPNATPARSKFSAPTPIPSPGISQQRAGSRSAVRQPNERLGNALGWFSVGLGLAQLLAPRQVARVVGADEREAATSLTLRLLGGRELASGLGLLSKASPAAWAWTRVAGDALDLALVGRALSSRRAQRERLLLFGAGVLGVACVDAYSARRLQREARDVASEGIAVQQAVTIARPLEEVYGFLRDFANLPRFLSHLEAVQVDNGSSHWRAKGPLGSALEWDAEVLEDWPGRLIIWRSVANGDVRSQGFVQFRRVGTDTEVDVELRYDPPPGKLRAAVAQLFGAAPGQELATDLRRLKQVLETGEVLHSDASIHRGMHPARPSELSARVSEQVRS